MEQTGLTVEELKNALPEKLKNFAKDELVQKINSITSDPQAASLIRENFLSYTTILQEGNFKFPFYIDAITYCSFKLMGYSNEEAYARTFPSRYANLKARGKDPSPYITAYHKNKLVNKIMEQSLIPSWLLNQDAYQEAINKNLQLMRTAKSERVQAMAADSLLKNLAPPAPQANPLINIDLRQNSGLDELKEAVLTLARKQKEAIEQGMTTKEVAEQKLFKDIEINGKTPEA